MLVVTTNDIPGWEIQRVCGEVFGLTVRSRNVFSNIGASFKSLAGGELQGMTKNLADSRNEVMGRMLEAARARGGNAVVGMRFDTSEMGDVWTELCAYGTAIVAIPVTDGAKRTAMQLGYGQPAQGQPAQGQPAQGQPAQGPAQGQPAQGQPAGGPPSQSPYAQPGADDLPGISPAPPTRAGEHAVQPQPYPQQPPQDYPQQPPQGYPGR